MRSRFFHLLAWFLIPAAGLLWTGLPRIHAEDSMCNFGGGCAGSACSAVQVITCSCPPGSFDYCGGFTIDLFCGGFMACQNDLGCGGCVTPPPL